MGDRLETGHEGDLRTAAGKGQAPQGFPRQVMHRVIVLANALPRDRRNWTERAPARPTPPIPLPQAAERIGAHMGKVRLCRTPGQPVEIDRKPWRTSFKGQLTCNMDAHVSRIRRRLFANPATIRSLLEFNARRVTVIPNKSCGEMRCLADKATIRLSALPCSRTVYTAGPNPKGRDRDCTTTGGLKDGSRLRRSVSADCSMDGCGVAIAG